MYHPPVFRLGYSSVNWDMKNAKFVMQIEVLTGRRVIPRKAGRPQRVLDDDN
jgi:hypothetical protein